jgi:hypothetical protein
MNEVTRRASGARGRRSIAVALGATLVGLALVQPAHAGGNFSLVGVEPSGARVTCQWTVTESFSSGPNRILYNSNVKCDRPMGYASVHSVLAKDSGYGPTRDDAGQFFCQGWVNPGCGLTTLSSGDLYFTGSETGLFAHNAYLTLRVRDASDPWIVYPPGICSTYGVQVDVLDCWLSSEVFVGT